MCPIKGQVRKECASYPNCTVTCSNSDSPPVCAEVCVPYGCECPTGKVVNEDINECVTSSECPSITSK